jgi:hypothetical protein
MQQVLIKINDYTISVEVLGFNKRIPQTWSEPEEPAHFDIGDIVLVANPRLEYDEIEKLVGVHDLCDAINEVLLEAREKLLNEY